MRLKLSESFEALRDTVKGSNKGNKVSPEPPVGRDSTNSGKAGRNSDTLRRLRGSSSTTDVAGGSTGNVSDASGERTRELSEPPPSSAKRTRPMSKLWGRGSSLSVPDLLGGGSGSNNSSARDSKASAGDPVALGDAELSDSVSEMVSTANILAGNDGTGSVRSVRGGGAPRKSDTTPPPSAGGHSVGKKHGRRMSYGVFFKPGFMVTSAPVQPPTAEIRLSVEEEEEEEEEDEDLDADGGEDEDVRGEGMGSEGGEKKLGMNIEIPQELSPVLKEERTRSPVDDGTTRDLLFGPLTRQQSITPDATSTIHAVAHHATLLEMPSSHSVDSLGPPVRLSAAQNTSSVGSLVESVGSASTSARLDSSASTRRKGPEAMGIGPFVTSVEQRGLLSDTLSPVVLEHLDVREEGWWRSVDPDADVPRFLPLNEVTAPPVLAMEPGVTESGKPLLAGGTLAALVQLLASEGSTDTEYIVDFLTTYRYFADAVDVARLLIVRYIVISSAVDTNTDSKNSAAPATATWAAFLQLKILNVFKKWIETYPSDFCGSRGGGGSTHPAGPSPLRFLLSAFLTHYVARDEKRAPFATAMLKNLSEKTEQPATVLPAQRVAELLVPRPLHHGSSEPNLSHGRRTSAGTLPPSNLTPTREKTSSMNASGTSLSKTMSPLTLDTSIRSRRLSGLPSDTQRRTSTSQLDVQGGSAAGLPRSGSSTGIPPIFGSEASCNTVDEQPLASSITAEFNPETLAQQLTLLEHQTFRSILPRELFHQSWNASDKHTRAPHLTMLITWFNRIAYGVATQVVTQQDLKTRVTLVKRFIHVAHMCYAWGNFNTVFEIVAGLNVGPVTRLKRTWKALPKKYWDVWNQLNAVVSSENSYKTYRGALRSLQAQHSTNPILPYLGVNLSDLTFAEDGNPTHITSAPPSHQPHTPQSLQSPPAQPVINFTKFRLISTLIRSVSLLQNRAEYVFPADPRVQNFLLTAWGVLDDAELYAASKVVEPRIVVL